MQLVQLPPAGPQAVALMATHWLVEPQQNPAPQFPPAVPPTTHWAEQVLFTQVGVLPSQATQMSPLPPQAPLLVPAVQVLFEQQPPLQSCVGPQTLVHLWLVVLQAKPVGQSPGTLHPQTLLTQAVPSAFPTQLTQLPGAPQLVEVLAQLVSGGIDWSGGGRSGSGRSGDGRSAALSAALSTDRSLAPSLPMETVSEVVSRSAESFVTPVSSEQEPSTTTATNTANHAPRRMMLSLAM